MFKKNSKRNNLYLLDAFLIILFLYFSIIKSPWYILLFVIVIYRLWMSKPKIYWFIIFFSLAVIYILLLIFINKYNLFHDLGNWIDQMFNFSIRNSIVNWINNIYEPKVSNFINLILFNIKVDQSSEFYQMTIEMGIVYLICVSGFHLSLLKKIIYLIFGKFKKTSYVASNLLIFFYTYLLNFSFGALRVLLTNIISPLIKKYDNNIYTPLASSGLVLMFLVPNCPNYMSFTLSYIGTIAVFIVVNFKINNFFFEKILINLFATLATLPFILMMNNQISLLAIINGYIFSYLFSFTFVYFLFFAWVPFFAVIHNFIVDSILFIIGFYNKNNIIISLNELAPYFNALYYLFYFGLISFINYKIKI